MRAAAVVVIAGMLGSSAAGCAHGHERYVAFGAEFVCASIGVAIRQSAQPSPDDDPIDQGGRSVARLGGTVMIGVGVVGFVATLLTGQLEPEPEPPAAPARIEPPAFVADAKPDAIRLTEQAQRAAVAGLCDTVEALRRKVTALDEDYAVQVFLRDPTIRRCL